MSESEPKHRLRVSKACDRCRVQKIKCSGTNPCVTCVKHNRQCLYSNSLKVVQNDNDTNSIDNSRRHQEFIGKTNDERGYIEHLENRIQYLESRLTRDNGATTNVVDSDNKKEAVPGTAGSFKWRDLNRDHLILMRQLCTTTYNHLNDENKKNTQLPRQQLFGWNLSGGHYLTPEQLPELPNVMLEKPVEHYVGYFMKEINPLYAVIHQLVFNMQYNSYKHLKHNKEITDNDLKLFEAILYLIVALAIRFTEMQNQHLNINNFKIEEQLFKFSYKVVAILSFEWDSFELVQCWILISIYLRVTYRQNSLFHSLGYAVTMCKSMGMGKDLLKPIYPGTHYELLKNRRIFFAVFTLERLFGLQIGKFCGLNQNEIELAFPSRDFKLESSQDDWISLPALAMIHVAKLSTIVDYSKRDKIDMIQFQHLNRELVNLNDWLDENGFGTSQLFTDPNEFISSLIKAQVKLGYYDVILSVHGKVLFNYVGQRLAARGLDVDLVLDACVNTVDIIGKINEARLLYVPWPLTLMLLFHVGTNLLIFISVGMFLTVSREYYSKIIKLITVFENSSIDGNEEINSQSRFKMAQECLWALRNAAYMISLRLQQDLEALTAVGIDAGSGDINRHFFAHYGLVQDPKSSDRKEFSDLMRTGKKRKVVPTHINAKILPQTIDNNTSQNSNSGLNDKENYNNLIWFDQWLNVGFDSSTFLPNHDAQGQFPAFNPSFSGLDLPNDSTSSRDDYFL